MIGGTAVSEPAATGFVEITYDVQDLERVHYDDANAATALASDAGLEAELDGGIAFVPLTMFAVLFGLSMDYEVFLLSRVREAFVRSGDSHASVGRGPGRHRSGVITSAVLIMISVFGAFIVGADPVMKMFGRGLTAAVLIDATLVRMALVPATMSLLGKANWWLPRWLDRILPNVDLDGGEDAPVITLPEREVPPVAV